MTVPRDPSLDTLMDLDGEVLVVDPEGSHWVRFVITRVPVSPEKPHGLDYSLTLLGPDGERLCEECAKKGGGRLPDGSSYVQFPDE